MTMPCAASRAVSTISFLKTFQTMKPKLCASHPSDGCDAQSFGFMVWKVFKNEIVLTARDAAHGIVIESDTAAFRFHIGRFRFGIYGLGWRAVDHIDSSFPNNDGGAGELAFDNVQYHLELGDEAYIPRSLIIGHIGNPESGCEQVWVAEP